MTRAISGRTSPTPFAQYDPATSSLRTSQGTLLSDWTSCSVILPRSGSMRSGLLYRRATLGPATPEPASSSLLPTPTVPNGGRTMSDEEVLAKGKTARGKRQVDLASAVRVHLLPTPAVNDMGEGKTPEAWDEWTAKMQAKHANGNGHGKSLAIEVLRLLPTPTVGDSKAACNSTATRHRTPPTGVHAGDTLTDVVRKLLPTPTVGDAGSSRTMPRGNLTLKGVIEGTRPSDDRRHGASTKPPSDAMSESSDGQLPLL